MSKDSVIKKSSLVPTVLVYNGISFLGLNLCTALLEKGARVVVLDKVDDEVRSRAKKLLAHPNFALFNIDPDKGLPEKIHSVDYIFSLAYPEDYTLENRDLVSEAFATKHLLDLAVASKAKFALIEPLFYKKVEGENSEKYSYEKNSSFLRSLIWDYIDNRNLNGRIIRLCQIYGSGMPLESSTGLVRFLRSILEHRNLKIFGEGVAKGYYLHIDDAVEGIIKALFYKRTSGRIFKLISEDSHADLELAFIFKSLANSEVNLEYGEGTFEEFVFNTTLGETVPRWEAEVSLKEGLQRTLEGFGYVINRHAFKPASVIENKLKEKAKVEEINSILDLKRENEDQPSTEKKFFYEEERKFFPKISLPSINFALPKISLPKFPASSIFPKNRTLSFILAAVVSLILFTVIAPLSFTAYSTKRAVNSLEEVSMNMSQLQTDYSKDSAKEAFENFHKAKNSFGRVAWLFKLIGQGQTYKSVNNLLDSATYFTGSLYRTTKALEPFSNIWEIINPNSSTVFQKEDFETSQQELTHARNTLDMSLASYKSIEENELPKFMRAHFREYGSVLEKADNSLNDALFLSGVLPEVVGVDESREYLLLFQNSNELRPTGGFIGSYATLTLEDGKIKRLNLDDIYNPDGQIDAREIVSEIPEPLAEFLKEDRLHIRNANWDPDFPSSVARIEDLFFKLENKDFDGVIALDLELIKSLLDVTGPIFLAAYNEEISSENLYERTQYYSEFDYQDGISDKRAFLTVLGSKLLERVFMLSSEEIPDFVDQIHTSLNKKHLLITMDNPSMSSFLSEKGWDGSMVSPSGDYLMIVNSNLGGTKANYFVENSYDYSVTSDTRDGLLRGHLVLNYKHDGLDNAWPGGPYTNYLRIYVPRGVLLTGATQSFDNSIPEDILENVVSYPENEYTVFATSFVLEPQQTLRLSLDYDLPELLSFNKESKEYSLYWQKQPGTVDDVLRFDFKGPFGTEIISYSPAGMLKEKNITAYETLFETDQLIDLVLK